MDKLTALWYGARYQDHLLQSYRKLHVGLQTVLIAIGVLLAIATISFGNTTHSNIMYGLLLVVSAVALYMLWAMKKLIAARSEDVNYYHNQLIAAEQHLPKEQQVLTAFKVYQKFGRNEADVTSHFLNLDLNDTVRKQLIEKGKGHTRKVLDRNLSIGFLCIWLCLHVAMLYTKLGAQY